MTGASLLLLLLLLLPLFLFLGFSELKDRNAAEERAFEGDSPLRRVYTLRNASDSNAKLLALFRSSSSVETNHVCTISSSMPLSNNQIGRAHV